MSSSVVNFFRSLVHNTMLIREQRGIVRPDMIHLLMQAKKGTLQTDDDTATTGKNIKPSMCKNISFPMDSGVPEYDALSWVTVCLKHQEPLSQQNFTLL